jgi:hypothetical protein
MTRKLTLLTVIAIASVMLSGGMLVALAQAQVTGSTSGQVVLRAADDYPSWMSGLGLFAAVTGGPVFSVVVCWYLLAKRLPKLEDDHRAEMRVMVESFQKQLEDLTVRFSNMFTTAQANFRSDQISMWNVKKEGERETAAAIRELAAEIRDRKHSES